jgi:hypothetical protein
MTEARKHAILFSATILAARKLAELGDNPPASPAKVSIAANAVRDAEFILSAIDRRWPGEKTP